MGALLVVALVWLGAAGRDVVGVAPAADKAQPGASRFGDDVKFFLEDHCYDCHGDGVTKGNLDLTKLTGDMSTRPLMDRWTTIYDRIARGEMPPKKKPQPKPAEVQTMLGWIKPHLVTADRTRREVVQRRLNREEYNNTIRDLLGIDIDLRRDLPEDQHAGGFDNNGEALAISTELMGSYIEAAQAALDAAIETGPAPKVVTLHSDSYKETEKYIPNNFVRDGDRLVMFTSRNDISYSKISTRDARVPTDGVYRFKFTAASYKSETPVAFCVAASDFAGVGAQTKIIGYYEAGPEPKEFVIEAAPGRRWAIQFFAQGLPSWVRDPGNGEHPGVGVSPIEITGPIYDQWPPKHHTQLFGDVDLAKGAAADAERILRKFMPRAFRRPVTDAEVARYVRLVENATSSGRRFEDGIRLALTGVLCSPNFLYLREDVSPGSTRVSDYELASRLSYFFWSSMPDDELMTLAASGTLHEPDVLDRQVERLLNDPRGERFIDNFTGQWLRLRDIAATTPDRKLYPDFDQLLEYSMVQESQAFFRTLLSENLSIDNLIDSDFAMLNQRLARHYGIDGVVGLAIRKVKLPADSVRGGVLTQGAVLKVTANGTTTSPVIRGVWVMENILGHAPPPPPPNVNGIEPDIRAATTIRERLAAHRNDPSCSACHAKIDPPGFALESFDPVGAYRDNYLQWVPHKEHPEKGWGSVAKAASVDASGELPSGEKFANVRELKKLLLSHREDFTRCMAEKLLTYGLGRELGFADRDAVHAIVKSSMENGDGLRTLVHEIVRSPTFITR
ncbi:MAG: DUF1592 domain-containing protein [Phycisphaera sp.]|nr:DUF1592 domain-containing protein [Phycisphaera sp.]